MKLTLVTCATGFVWVCTRDTAKFQWDAIRVAIKGATKETTAYADFKNKHKQN